MAVLPLLLTWGLFSHCPPLEASLIDKWQGVGWYIKLLFFKNQTKISSSPKCWYTENARCSTPQLTSALCNLPAGDLCAVCVGGDLHVAAAGWSRHPLWLLSRSKFKCLFSWNGVCIIDNFSGLVAYMEVYQDVLEQPRHTECSQFLPTAVRTVGQRSSGRGGCVEQLISRKGIW